jgi:hypothetical protein
MQFVGVALVVERRNQTGRQSGVAPAHRGGTESGQWGRNGLGVVAGRLVTFLSA